MADPLSPVTFVNKINVPVYMACQWTDEQTGGHCPTLAEHFTGTQRKWFTFTNGTHVDSLDPETFNRWYDFLQLYVAKQAPITNSAAIQAAAPVIYQEAMGISGQTLPPDPVQQQPTYDGARWRRSRTLKPIRILFDSGAGGPSAGMPDPGFEQSFSSFPIPGVTGRSWYLTGNGGLSGKGGHRPRRLVHVGRARPSADRLHGRTSTGAGGLWTATPDYHWEQHPPGSAVSYLTRPLRTDTTVIGAGAVNLWVRSSTPNVDLQATVTEVRPDDKETFVQSGWVRGNERKLDRLKSTPLEPVLSLRESAVSPLPRRPVRQGHDPPLLRGARVPRRLANPGHDLRPERRRSPSGRSARRTRTGRRRFRSPHSARKPSRLTLPVVPGVDVPTGLPPCPGLQGRAMPGLPALRQPPGDPLNLLHQAFLASRGAGRDEFSSAPGRRGCRR